MSSLPRIDARPQRTPAAVAAVLAIVLILSMFLDWYALDLPQQVGGREVDAPTYNAFEGLERSDIALLVVAVLALIFAGVLYAGMMANSAAPGLALLGAGVFVLAVIVYRGLSRPARLLFGGEVDTTLQFGWFIAVVASAVLALSGLLAYRAGPRLEFEVDEPENDEESSHREPERG